MSNFSGQPENLLTSDFDYELPAGFIASKPVNPRDSAKLLHVRGDKFSDYLVRDLPELLKPGDLMVMNDTKVIPARLYGFRGERKCEVFLHRKKEGGKWLALARPFKKLRAGDEIKFSREFCAKIIEKHQGGEVTINFSCSENELPKFLQEHGHVPLPPYIAREDNKADRSDYQTIYAQREGAVAAPTAGLHFTPELLSRLDEKGISRVMVTLHVGIGTFLPVKSEFVRDHVMHSEWGEINKETAEKINSARRSGKRIVAIGTTVLRLLETAADEDGILKPFTGDTSIFIYPGYKFKTADVLMTNFHLPKSTLFMLVSAFMGLERMKAAYQHAIKNNYRFYSYGDANLLERLEN